MADHHRTGRCSLWAKVNAKNEIQRTSYVVIQATGHCDTPYGAPMQIIWRIGGDLVYFFLQQSSWRNLSQWLHPNVLPGLPYRSGTIVSCSRNTSRSVAAVPVCLYSVVSSFWLCYNNQHRYPTTGVLSPDVPGRLIFRVVKQRCRL